MTPARAVLLGLIQGLTEFLPVSSSGHLIVIPRLLGWAPQPLSFDVALHLGTALAVLLYFRRDFVQLVRGGVVDIVTHGVHVRRWSPVGRLGLLVALGCVPAVIVGGPFGGRIEEHTRSPWLTVTMLVVFGLVMLAAERWAHAACGYERLDARRALLVGAAQAAALVPGVSRSGATIAAGMFAGLTRETAARFSFLMAAPVILAAGVKELPDLRHAPAEGVSAVALTTGFLVSFAVGLATVHLLLRYVAARSLRVFVWYRFVFAALAVVVLTLR
jgi:undecaprenyl-diphosphatase